MRRLVEIHVPSAGTERHEFKDTRLAVGTGAECRVRLGAGSGLPGRALELEVRDDGVLVEVAATSTIPVLHNGLEQRRVLVPWGEELFLGPVRFTFLEDRTSRSNVVPILAGALLVMVAVAGVLGMNRLRPADASSKDLEPPPLTAEVTACPGGQPALHQAEAAFEAARAREERFPFSREEGVDALRLYQEARICFQAAGQTEGAARVAQELERWSARMDEEYASLRLRLRLALDQGRHADGLDATRGLEVLLGPADEGQAVDPYRMWLQAVRRELERKLAKARK